MRVRCSVCRSSFPAERTTARYCSSACSQKAYRRRKSVSVSVRLKPHFTAKKANWETPQALFDELDVEFGFQFDLAADETNAKCDRFYTIEDDALNQPWEGVCWLNPPFGRGIELWLSRAVEAAQAGATVVVLVPARTDTIWWHDLVIPHAEIRFLRGRLQFEGAATSAPFPSAILVYR
jgi:phage N-6-adenine-methyltransferase